MSKGTKADEQLAIDEVAYGAIIDVTEDLAVSEWLITRLPLLDFAANWAETVSPLSVVATGLTVMHKLGGGLVQQWPDQTLILLGAEVLAGPVDLAQTFGHELAHLLDPTPFMTQEEWRRTRRAAVRRNRGRESFADHLGELLVRCGPHSVVEAMPLVAQARSVRSARGAD